MTSSSIPGSLSKTLKKMGLVISPSTCILWVVRDSRNYVPTSNRKVLLSAGKTGLSLPRMVLVCCFSWPTFTTT